MIVTVRDWGFGETENSFLELAAALPTDTEKLKEMLDSGLDINAPSKNGRNTLAYCALEQFGEYNSVCTRPHVFSAYEQDGELHMKYDTSALLEVVQLFLSHGMDVNGSTVFGTILDTMLYGANDENTLAAARLLLEHAPIRICRIPAGRTSATAQAKKISVRSRCGTMQSRVCPTITAASARCFPNLAADLSAPIGRIDSRNI